MYDVNYREKTSVGMYNGCDTLSLQTLFVYFLALHAIPTSSFNFIQLFFYLFLQEQFCMMSTIMASTFIGSTSVRIQLNFSNQLDIDMSMRTPIRQQSCL